MLSFLTIGLFNRSALYFFLVCLFSHLIYGVDANGVYLNLFQVMLFCSATYIFTDPKVRYSLLMLAVIYLIAALDYQLFNYKTVYYNTYTYIINLIDIFLLIVFIRGASDRIREFARMVVDSCVRPSDYQMLRFNKEVLQ